jgi:organic radical activating enzyme
MSEGSAVSGNGLSPEALPASAVGMKSHPRTGAVTEVYSTLQGEGPFLGERQIFVRLAGCPWRCRYCDTPGSLGREGAGLITVEGVLDRIHHLQEERPHATVSVTGGEPLAQADFLAELLPAVRRLGWRAYLETSGTQPDQLAKVVDECDVVAMDIKLPSAVGREFWAEHAAFLKACGGKAFAKVVLTADVTDDEFERAVRLLAEAQPVPLLVLQPVTPTTELTDRLAGRADGKRLVPPPPHRLLSLWDAARHRLPDVRLIPQMHPVWGLP